jgi:hypothetical protein
MLPAIPRTFARCSTDAGEIGRRFAAFGFAANVEPLALLFAPGPSGVLRVRGLGRIR